MIRLDNTPFIMPHLIKNKMTQRSQSRIQRAIKHPISKIIIGSLFIIIMTFSIKELISKPIFSYLLESSYHIKIAVALTGSIVIVFAYYLFNRIFEKTDFTDFKIKNAGKDLTIGLFLGASIISCAVALISYLGYYKIIGQEAITPYLSTLTFIWGAAVLEEVVFRGLVFRYTEEWKGTHIAIMASAVIFQLPHFMNPHEALLPALLGILFGMAMATMYASTRTLWMPIAFHFAWNAMQPTLGTTLSGIGDFHNLKIAEISGPEIWTGSAFGIEDSIVPIVSCILISIYFYRKMQFKKLTSNS